MIACYEVFLSERYGVRGSGISWFEICTVCINQQVLNHRSTKAPNNYARLSSKIDIPNVYHVINTNNATTRKLTLEFLSILKDLDKIKAQRNSPYYSSGRRSNLTILKHIWHICLIFDHRLSSYRSMYFSLFIFASICHNPWPLYVIKSLVITISFLPEWLFWWPIL